MILFIGGLYYRQFYEIIDGNIILSNSFGIMTKIDLSKAVYEIKEFGTYFSWAISIPKKWICIYDKEKQYTKFKSGCSNKKRLQNANYLFRRTAFRIKKEECKHI